MAFTTARETPSLTNQEEKAEKARLLEEHGLLIAKIATAKEQVKNLQDLSEEISLKQARVADFKKQITDLDALLVQKKAEKDSIEKLHGATNEHLTHITTKLGASQETLANKQSEITVAAAVLESKKKEIDTHTAILSDLKDSVTQQQAQKKQLDDSITSLTTTNQKVQSDLETIKNNLALATTKLQETVAHIEQSNILLDVSRNEFSTLLKKKEEAQKFIENAAIEAKNHAEKIISDTKEAIENKEKLLAAQLDEVALQSKMFTTYKAKLRAWKEEVETQTGTKLPISIPE